MASSESNVPNAYAYRGRYLLSQYHERHKHIPDHKLSEVKVLLNRDPSPTLPVCIIGAGVTGLYTAMIFESLGINYQIVDADTPEHLGGRLFTYNFPNGGQYDYYDVGAMRFPKAPFMERFFDLVTNRNLGLKLIPYTMQMTEPSSNTFSFFNNSRINNGDSSVTDDPFNVSGYIDDPNLATSQGVSRKVLEALQPFRDLFRAKLGRQLPDIEKGMRRVFELTNLFSMRSYMSQVLRMSARDINWCETLDRATGWYDTALAETVLASLSLNWPIAPLPGPEPANLHPNWPWFGLDRGSSTLPRAMFDSLSQSAQETAQFRSPVTAISEDAQNNYMKISVNGAPSPQPYSAVISTVPLTRLSMMDLTGVNINNNYAQWSAIRELQYTSTVKIGIRFNSPWWETELPRPIRGGQSYTDLPSRLIVYPSYPEGATPESISKVLIVSYCTAGDAQRLSGLINEDGTGKPELIDLIFRDLAAVHGVTIEWLQQFYTPGEYFAWSWSNNPFTIGGYGVFHPGVYGNGDNFGEILQPIANGKFFIAGDVTSACHAWVAGALGSAWRAVDQYLALNQPESVRLRFWDLWGPTEYLDEASNEELVNSNRELMERHLVIALHKSGVSLPPRKQPTFPWGLLDNLNFLTRNV